MTLPRVALQVTGLPRFCCETDQLIHCWQNYQCVDWYMVLNSDHSATQTVIDTRWYQFTEEEIADQLRARLPNGHNLKLIQWRSGQEFVWDTASDRGHYCRWDHAQINYGLAQYCNLARRSLAVRDRAYDLVIRARLDAAPDTAIDLARASEQALLYPRAVAVSQRERQGPLQFCDHLIWGSAQAIDMVSDTVSWWPWALSRGIEANPELLTQFILRVQGLEWPTTDWNSTLKTRGSYTDNNLFHVDLGTWQLWDLTDPNLKL